jgi:hypothetical protein
MSKIKDAVTNGVAMNLSNTRLYFQRIMLYRKNIWRCNITGAGGKTYSSALDSEYKAMIKATERFPKVWTHYALEIIQFSTVF